MAKKSWIARDKKKADTVKRYAELRLPYHPLIMVPK